MRFTSWFAAKFVGRTARDEQYSAQSDPPAPMPAGQGGIETAAAARRRPLAQFWMMVFFN
jgi:hypothetical protein